MRLPFFMIALFALLVTIRPMSSVADESAAARPTFIVLAYHDVRDDVGTLADRDPDAINTDRLIAHFDWLKANGYHVVSVDDVLKSMHGGPALPPNAVLLTFDDGLESFYTRVYPLLRAYHYPAMAALVGSWMDTPEGQSMDYNGRRCTRACFLSWDQVRLMQRSGLVEFASHTWQLHKGILANLQGNQLPAAVTLSYDAQAHRYESESAYEARVRDDLSHSANEIERETGHRPRAIAWPYGAYNRVAERIASGLGMGMSLGLGDGLLAVQHSTTVPRLLVTADVTPIQLGWLMRHQLSIDPVRAVQVDLDYVYDPDPAQQERNLSALLDRIKRLHPSQVWLQAYADPKGDGVAEAVYFPNRHLPMRADLFSRVAWQLQTRANVQVYAWMPVLAFRFPGQPMLPTLGKPGDRDTERLAPWDPRVRQLIGDVYEDLAMHAPLSGLLFSDDAFIRDTDRLGPWANKNPAQRTAALIDFTRELADRVRQWHPELKTARNIYARPVMHPESETWFAQNLPAFLDAYDMTAIMAMPQLDGDNDRPSWYRKLVARVVAIPGAMNHTLFEVATHDWKSGQPMAASQVRDRLRLLEALGARHLGYYPDDFLRDQPDLDTVRPGISMADYPYAEPVR
jgi:poly-beta-1,6-N-acetyl-D-glucosamine N-deacetylase